MEPDRDQILDVALRALEWARERDYTGWEKHDGLNSPMLKTVLGRGTWPRILAIQGVMRFPLNLRPILGVRKHKNPKGVALFARAWLNLHAVTGENDHLLEARRLLDWLLANPAQGKWPGTCWGYPYPWQDPGFYAPAGYPNRIVTYFAGRALIHGFESTGGKRYLEGAQKAVEFILEAPRILNESDDMLCLSYVPRDETTMAVMDVPALCGALCAMVGHHTRDQNLLREGRRLLNWVVDKQTDYGAWYYTHPAGDSHITHDNYHTGEILDSILEYEKYSRDTGFSSSYAAGLHYYRENLFTANARPKWMNDKEFPHDIHGYSQGIISFTQSGDHHLANRIARTAIEDMWDDAESRFYYQKRKVCTKKLTLMRWCQAWMTFALSSLSLAQKRS